MKEGLKRPHYTRKRSFVLDTVVTTGITDLGHFARHESRDGLGEHAALRVGVARGERDVDVQSARARGLQERPQPDSAQEPPGRPRDLDHVAEGRALRVEVDDRVVR